MFLYRVNSFLDSFSFVARAIIVCVIFLTCALICGCVYEQCTRVEIL